MAGVAWVLAMGAALGLSGDSDGIPLPEASAGGSIGSLEDPGMKMFNHVRAAGALGAMAASQYAFQGAAAQAGVGAPPVQWRVQDGGNGHWYQLRTCEGLDFVPAREGAVAEGGDFVSIGSAGENDFVASFLPHAPEVDGLRCFLIGAVRRDASSCASDATAFRWLDGTPFEYTSWCPNGNPNCWGEELVQMPANVGCGTSWGDVGSLGNTAGINAVVIEWSADCNNDGIVDYGQCRDGSLPDFDGNNVPDCCDRGVLCTVGAYPVEWRTENGGNGHWYQARRTATRTNFDSKVAAARELGADLASIAGIGENAFVFDVVRASGLSAGRACIGGRRCGGCEWRWVDGTSWEFEPWGAGEPGNPGDVHVEMFISIGTPSKWADVWDFDGSERAYVVEWSADCDGDGTVDFGQILRGDRPDLNANGVPDGCECYADLNGDGVVQGADLGIMLASWGSVQAGVAADINRDGAVDGTDLGLLLSGWGPCGQ